MNDIEAKLAQLSGKKLAVICVGNPLRGDDGFGPAVALRLVSLAQDVAKRSLLYSLLSILKRKEKGELESSPEAGQSNAAARLRSQQPAPLASDNIFDAGSVPENVLPKVTRLEPETVVFVDAADFGAAPGTLRLVATDELVQGDFSTHSAPLFAATEYLRVACGAESILLAAQAKNTQLGAAMSAEMLEAAEQAASLLRTALALANPSLSQ